MKKLLYFGFFLLGLGILLSFFNSGGKIGYSTFENCSYKTYDNKVVVSYSLDGCRESVVDTEYKVVGKTLNIYYDLESHCGGCASMDYDDSFSVSRSSYDNVKVYYRYVEQEDGCEGMVYKPMIYIYPEHDMDLNIKLGNDDLLTSTYPKYHNSWNIHVSKDSTIYDYNTKRNYYGLYWEAKDSTKLDMNEGFVVKGEDTISFLEEKLAYLGLNDYEINEFVVYWINRLENNPYNYIYFRTSEEINNYMPLYFSEQPDSVIRVLVDFKPLDKKIKVKEQKLIKQERSGFSVVEWGATIH